MAGKGGYRPGAGRPKGSKNNAAIETRAGLWAYIASCGPDANPFKRMVDRMMSTENEAIEIACAQSLADRLLPKLKAIEISGDDDHPLHVLLAHFADMPYAQLHETLNPDGASLGRPHETA